MEAGSYRFPFLILPPIRITENTATTITAEIKQKLREEMGNNISEDDMKFLLKTFDDVSSRYRFSRKSR